MPWRERTRGVPTHARAACLPACRCWCPCPRADPDYLDFCKALEEGIEALPSASAQLEAQERAAGDGGGAERVVTPLMAYLSELYASRPGMKLGGLKKLLKEGEAKKGRDGASGGDGKVGGLARAGAGADADAAACVCVCPEGWCGVCTRV
jgi:hypothetical protein